MLFRVEPLRTVMAVAAFALVLMAMVWTATPSFATGSLGAGELGYGAILTTWMASMALGALVLGPRVPPALGAAVAVAAIGVQGLALVFTAAWLALAPVLAFQVLGGLAHGAKNVLLRTLIHETVPAGEHGTAAAAYNALRNGAELAALAAGGVLVTLLGARGTIALAGALPLPVALAGLAILARGRQRATEARAAPA